MNKYYYQKGRCEVNGYVSLNPVIYEPTDEFDKYTKVKMACNCIQDGKCDRETSCQLLQDAPEFVINDGIKLLNKKLG